MSAISATVSGDNTTAHVITTAVLGQAITQIAMWVMALNHIPTPDTATQAAIGVVVQVLSSFLMQKLSPAS